MKNVIKKAAVLMTSGLLMVSCVSEKDMESKLANILKKNPKLITDVIREHPGEVMLALQEASGKAREDLRKKQEEEEAKKFEEAFNSPLKPEIRKDEAIRGTKGAPIVLVEYSDFQCPFCQRGYNTVNQLLKRYNGKIQFIYKHLPLSFHDKAELTSRYYEAMRLQSNELAFKFHDLIFDKDVRNLSKGEPYLDSLVKEAGGNLSKVKKTINSEEVSKRIKDDLKEAAEFGMQGTPGFLINGIPLRGAYPEAEFVKIVDRLVKEGKIKI